MSMWRPDPTFYPSPKMAMDSHHLVVSHGRRARRQQRRLGYAHPHAGILRRDRRSWFNLDLIWAIALVVTGVVALAV